MRHRNLLSSCGVVGLLAGLLLVGCAKKQTAEEVSSDSLLASSPQETPASGNMNPQTSYEPGTSGNQTPPRSTPSRSTPSRSSSAPTRSVPSGTPINVAINASISSETANVGDQWTGTVQNSVVVDGKTLIPAGSTVTGTVSGARPARKGERAMLDLALSNINVDGRSYRVHGGTEAIEAGSTRARNLGAIAGGAAAGALIGKAVGGSSKGAIIGGIVGGAAATGAVAASKGYQVVLKPGTTIDFVTTESVAVRD